MHDRWAERRLAEGWKYGPERNDKLKTTPNLVAYADLPEIEKNYDRTTALTTLRALYRHGYEVHQASPATHGENDEASVVASEILERTHRLRFEEADALWRSHTPAFWRRHPDLIGRLARVASDAGWPLLAFDIASSTLPAESDGALPDETTASLRYVAALSLMEVGALERAAQEIGKIQDAPRLTGDLRGLRGRLAKARGLRSTDQGEARACFEEARSVYRSGYDTMRELFEKERNPEAGNTACYLGINAAAMAAWAGASSEAAKTAAEVLQLCDAVEEIHGDTGIDPWLEATRGEAHLLRHEGEAAAKAYRAASAVLHDRWRPLQSMRRQALETARRTGFPEDEVKSWFHQPALLVFGLSDTTAREKPEGAIVFYYLHKADQLPEAADLAAGCSEFQLGLVENPDTFRGRLKAEAVESLDTIMQRATRVLGQNETQIVREDIGAGLSRAFFRGSVLLRARELEITPTGLPVEAVSDQDFDRPGAPFRAVLCADAKGYSRLDAARLRVFAREFLGRVGSVVDSFRDQTITVKTAGDGLFMVFRNLQSAITFSLALRDSIRSVNWGELGLPEDLGLRISLDAGPVLEFDDPVTGRRDVAGSLVNRAARIEPITPVNHVYASRTVAALATALGIPDVRFEYAGETPLPKGFGAFQLYHLTRA